jgi:hypothetical protein
VAVSGIKDTIIAELHNQGLPVEVFYSIREMEQITDSIILADEAGKLLNVVNRKQHEEMLRTLRLVSHQNNRIVLVGLPFDFKKIFSAQATCFLYKSLNIAEMINGSTVKETLLEYKDYHLGAYTLSLPKSQVLCYDAGGFWIDDIDYFPEFDSKANNINLFKKIKKGKKK